MTRHHSAFRSTHCAAIFAGALLCLCQAAAAQPRVALLPFHATREMDRTQVQRIGSAYYYALAAVNGLDLMSATETDSRFDATRYATAKSAATAAATQLGVDYIIFGTAYPSGSRAALETGILDTRTQQFVGRSLTPFTDAQLGSPETLAATNLKPLLHSMNLQHVDAITTPKRTTPPLLDLVDAPDATSSRASTRTRRHTTRHPLGISTALAGHLEVGTRLAVVTLSDTTPEYVLGTISSLDTRQNILPWRLYADWFFDTHWGVELGWDAYAARARTQPNNTSDGEFRVRGPVMMVLGRYPNASRWTPYAGIGIALFTGTFKAETWWSQGFPTQQEWVRDGAPSTSLSGVTQSMNVDDPVGLVWQVGCQMHLSDRWSAEATVRHVTAELDIEHDIRVGGTLLERQITRSQVDLSNVSYGLGIRYAL